MANFITSIRIVISITLLFCTPFSAEFYILYLSAGFTDMIDGTIARKTHTVTDLGSKLDTIADFIFVIACLIKLLPIIDVPQGIYIWIGVIVLIKLINVISGFVIQKKFVSIHSVFNKITGALLFIFPMTLSFINIKYSAIVLCVIATFASIQEGHFIRTKKENITK